MALTLTGTLALGLAGMPFSAWAKKPHPNPSPTPTTSPTPSTSPTPGKPSFDVSVYLSHSPEPVPYPTAATFTVTLQSNGDSQTSTAGDPLGVRVLFPPSWNIDTDTGASAHMTCSPDPAANRSGPNQAVAVLCGTWNGTGTDTAVLARCQSVSFTITAHPNDPSSWGGGGSQAAEAQLQDADQLNTNPNLQVADGVYVTPSTGVTATPGPRNLPGSPAPAQPLRCNGGPSPSPTATPSTSPTPGHPLFDVSVYLSHSPEPVVYPNPATFTVTLQSNGDSQTSTAGDPLGVRVLFPPSWVVDTDTGASVHMTCSPDPSANRSGPGMSVAILCGTWNGAGTDTAVLARCQSVSFTVTAHPNDPTTWFGGGSHAAVAQLADAQFENTNPNVQVEDGVYVSPNSSITATPGPRNAPGTPAPAQPIGCNGGPSPSPTASPTATPTPSTSPTPPSKLDLSVYLTHSPEPVVYPNEAIFTVTVQNNADSASTAGDPIGVRVLFPPSWVIDTDTGSSAHMPCAPDPFAPSGFNRQPALLCGVWEGKGADSAVLATCGSVSFTIGAHPNDPTTWGGGGSHAAAAQLMDAKGVNTNPNVQAFDGVYVVPNAIFTATPGPRNQPGSPPPAFPIGCTSSSPPPSPSPTTAPAKLDMSIYLSHSPEPVVYPNVARFTVTLQNNADSVSTAGDALGVRLQLPSDWAYDADTGSAAGMPCNPEPRPVLVLLSFAAVDCGVFDGIGSSTAVMAPCQSVSFTVLAHPNDPLTWGGGGNHAAFAQFQDAKNLDTNPDFVVMDGVYVEPTGLITATPGPRNVPGQPAPAKPIGC